MDLNANIRKHILLISSIIECFLLAGPVNGWPSLVYVLRDSGYFSDLCLNSTATTDGIIEYGSGQDYVSYNRTLNSDDSSVGYPTCTEQDARLQLVFIIGSFGINTGALIFGFIYDSFGLRTSRIISSSILLAGFLMFAFSSPTKSSILFVALYLSASGCSNLLISNPQVGNLFGNYRSTIITLHCGAVGSSAITMLFIQLAYSGGISMMVSFCFLAGVTVFSTINTFLLLPKYKIPWTLPPKTVAVTHSTEKPADENVNENQSNISSEKEWMEDEYKTLVKCLKSPMFLLFTTWIAVLQLINYFYIGTINPRLQQLSNGKDEIISTYTKIYTVLVSTFIVFTFLCGIVLDRNKKHRSMTCQTEGSKQGALFGDLQDSVLALLLTNLFTALFGICSMIPIVQLQICTFVLQLISRSFLFGLIVGFPAITFPSKYFGSVYGVSRIIASCVVVILQYTLLLMVQHLFDGNPFYVDVLLLLLNVCSLSQPLYVYYFLYKRTRRPLCTTQVIED